MEVVAVFSGVLAAWYVWEVAGNAAHLSEAFCKVLVPAPPWYSEW